MEKDQQLYTEQRYNPSLEDRAKLEQDIQNLKEIRERVRLTEEKKARERALEPQLHPVRSFVKRRLLGIQPPRLVENYAYNQPLFQQQPGQQAVQPGQQVQQGQQQGEFAPGAVGQMQELRLRTAVQSISKRLNEVEEVVNYILREFKKRMENTSDLAREKIGFAGQAIKDSLIPPKNGQQSETSRRNEEIWKLRNAIAAANKPPSFEKFMETQSPIERAVNPEQRPAVQTPVGTPTVVEKPTPQVPTQQAQPTSEVVKAGPREFVMPGAVVKPVPPAAVKEEPKPLGIEKTLIPGLQYTSNTPEEDKAKRALVQRIENRTTNTIPPEIANNQALTPEQKYKAYVDWLDKQPKPDVSELQAEVFKLEHPIIAKRMETVGSNVYVDKDGHKHYINDQEKEEYEKNFGKKRSNYADDATEAIRELGRQLDENGEHPGEMY